MTLPVNVTGTHKYLVFSKLKQIPFVENNFIDFFVNKFWHLI